MKHVDFYSGSTRELKGGKLLSDKADGRAGILQGGDIGKRQESTV